MMSSVAAVKSHDGVRIPTGRAPVLFSSTSALRIASSRSSAGGRVAIRSWIQPCIADLVAFGRVAAHLVGVQQRGYRRHEERRRYPSVGQQRQDPPRPHPRPNSPWESFPGPISPSRSGMVS